MGYAPPRELLDTPLLLVHKHITITAKIHCFSQTARSAMPQIAAISTWGIALLRGLITSGELGYCLKGPSPLPGGGEGTNFYLSCFEVYYEANRGRGGGSLISGGPNPRPGPLGYATAHNRLVALGKLA